MRAHDGRSVNDVVWWEIETSEPEEFQRFHAALSDWTFTPAFDGTELRADYWVIQRDGSDVGGLQRGTAPTESAGTRIYLLAEDLEAMLDRIVELGGRIERPRVALERTQWFALFRDSAGVVLGLWTANPPKG